MCVCECVGVGVWCVGVGVWEVGSMCVCVCVCFIRVFKAKSREGFAKIEKKNQNWASEGSI